MSFPPTTYSVLPLVALRGVGKSFASGTHALAGLDLEIRPGEFLSLLGPSGCGKSTALRIIAGLSAPSEGVIEWPVRGRSGGKSGLGFVFQEPTLMPWTSVFDNVKLPLDLHRMSIRKWPAAWTRHSNMSAFRRFAMPIRANCRAACACVFPSPARW